MRFYVKGYFYTHTLIEWRMNEVSKVNIIEDVLIDRLFSIVH